VIEGGVGWVVGWLVGRRVVVVVVVGWWLVVGTVESVNGSVLVDGRCKIYLSSVVRV
jgi:hypothetical protein